MKITLESAEELEVIIRGVPGSASVQAVLNAVQTAAGVSKLFLYREEREFLFQTAEISYFETCGRGVTAVAGGQRYEARYRLYQLAEMLHSAGFVQISKSTLVNVNHVASVEAEFSGNYTAFLKSGEKLLISRKYMKAFRNYVMEG